MAEIVLYIDASFGGLHTDLYEPRLISPNWRSAGLRPI
jgi:hypothetical protein